MIDIAISLVIYNPNLHDLEKLFKSVSIQQGVTFEFLIYDNSPHRNDLECKYFPLNYQKGVENVGFGRAHNQNFNRSSPSEFFLIINPDIYFDDPFMLKKIVDRMRNKPKVGLSSVRMLSPDGSLQDTHRLLPMITDIMKRFFLNKLKIYDSTKHQYTLSDIDKTQEFKCPNICGAFMLIRSNLFKDLKGFDEGIFLYFEDIDLSRRAHLETREMNTVFGDLTVYHTWGRAGYRSLESFKIHILSLAYYFQKYGVFRDKYALEVNKKSLKSHLKSE